MSINSDELKKLLTIPLWREAYLAGLEAAKGKVNSMLSKGQTSTDREIVSDIAYCRAAYAITQLIEEAKQ